MQQSIDIRSFLLFFFCAMTIAMEGMPQAVIRRELRHTARKKVYDRPTLRTHYSIFTRPSTCEPKDGYKGVPAVRACLDNPDFALTDIKHVITAHLPYIPVDDQRYSNHCAINDLIQCVVNKAVQDRERESTYGAVLALLHEHGWSADGACCSVNMLHTAVKHDLLSITRILIETAGYEILNEDALGRSPQHYIQSADLCKDMLCRLPYIYLNAQDCDGNTPLHLAPACVVHSLLQGRVDPSIVNEVPFSGLLYQTPLRKAVAEMDALKCEKLLNSPKVILIPKEYRLLRDYTRNRLFDELPCRDDLQDPKRSSLLHILALLERFK